LHDLGEDRYGHFLRTPSTEVEASGVVEAIEARHLALGQPCTHGRAALARRNQADIGRRGFQHGSS
jgi:hypothetical protein